MSLFQDLYRILSNNALTESCFDMVISCPDIAQAAEAGQFIQIRCSEKILRRPISFCEINKENNTVRIVYEVRGEGTEWLSKRYPGEKIDILGPLGKGFKIVEGKYNPLIIGGGIGSPPLLEAAKLFNNKVDSLLGFKSAKNSILIDDFRRYCKNVYITTDDGSLGFKGLTVDYLEEIIEKNKHDLIFSCGPVFMLKAVANIAKKHVIDCFVSMEERMGCGVGACLVCACEIKSDGVNKYRHVCKDGPVFNASEVVW